MPIKMIAPIIILFLHDLFTAVWIGGLITLSLVVMPSVQKAIKSKAESSALIRVIQKRLSTLVYISMAGLMITGILLGKQSSMMSGAFQFTNPYASVISIKHILIILMLAIAFYRSLYLAKKIPTGSAIINKQYKITQFCNLGLGVIVIFLSAAAAIIYKAPQTGAFLNGLNLL